MKSDDLKLRTKRLALRILKVADQLPKTVSGKTLAHQIARSGTSIAANYRSACKGRSKSEFIAKLGIAEEEADETQFWIEMIVEAGLIPESKLKDLLQETKEITAIIAASRKTASQ